MNYWLRPRLPQPVAAGDDRTLSRWFRAYVREHLNQIAENDSRGALNMAFSQDDTWRLKFQLPALDLTWLPATFVEKACQGYLE